MVCYGLLQFLCDVYEINVYIYIFFFLFFLRFACFVSVFTHHFLAVHMYYVRPQEEQL